MYRKTILLAVLLALIAVLTACGSPSTPVLDTDTNSTQQGQASSSIQMTIQSKLGVGILKMDGTDLAVTADQAQDLLPLWRALKNLTASSSADEEIAALYQQIEETLSTDQVESIQLLSWTQAELSVMMQQYGVQPGSSVSMESSSASETTAQTSQSSVQGGGELGGPGGMPGGEPPAGDPALGTSLGGTDGSSQSQSTEESDQSASGGSSHLNLMLAEVVIQYLQEQVGL